MSASNLPSLPSVAAYGGGCRRGNQTGSPDARGIVADVAARGPHPRQAGTGDPEPAPVLRMA